MPHGFKVNWGNTHNAWHGAWTTLSTKDMSAPNSSSLHGGVLSNILGNHRIQFVFSGKHVWFTNCVFKDIISQTAWLLTHKCWDSSLQKERKRSLLVSDPTAVLRHEGSWPQEGNCFVLRLFGCFEQMDFQEESNRRNWKTNFSRNWRALTRLLSKRAKGNPHWFAWIYLTTLNQFLVPPTRTSASSLWLPFLLNSLDRRCQTQKRPRKLLLSLFSYRLKSSFITHRARRMRDCHLAENQHTIFPGLKLLLIHVYLYGGLYQPDAGKMYQLDHKKRHSEATRPCA